MISKICIEKIKEAARIEEVVKDFIPLKIRGKTIKANCEKCGAQGKFEISATKQIAGCWVCSIHSKGAINYLMNWQNMAYQDALIYLGQKYSIDIQYDKKASGKKSKTTKRSSISFRDKQLRGSGIPVKRQRYLLDKDGHSKVEVDRYQAASIDQYWKVDPHGDDMILHYRNLEGDPMTYREKRKGKDIPFIRVRYENPEQHLDRNGNPKKYSQPYKSGTHLWIPETVIKMYQDGAIIETLYIDEGEKKATKKSLHGMPTVGVMGINNLVKEKQLPREFEKIIKKCQVKNVVFTFDADWLDIKASEEAPVDNRPRTFFAAARKYLHHFRAFQNTGIQLNIYLGAIKHNDLELKGVDDLLVSKLLKGKEELLLKDYQAAMIDANGDGEFVQLHKIEGWTDLHLQKLWGLQSPVDFINMHREKLKNLKRFKLRGKWWRFNDRGDHELEQQLLPGEKYWHQEIQERNGKEFVKYNFDFYRIRIFLRNHGFSRIRMQDGEYKFIRLDGRTITETNAQDIRDYVLDYTEDIGEIEVLTKTILPGANRYLGLEALRNIYRSNLELQWNDQDTQYFFFNKKYWKITADGIEEGQLEFLPNYIWADQRINFDPVVLEKPLVQIGYHDKLQSWGLIDQNEEAQQRCDYFNFLVNTSNNHHRVSKDVGDLKGEWQAEVNEILASKLSAMGYALHRYYEGSNRKAVVCMDTKFGEVGESNGRSGKSLFGMAAAQIHKTFEINGKQPNLNQDKFLFDGLDERHALIFMDDIRKSFDFELLLADITNSVKVNPKGATAFRINLKFAQKFIITTNHAIKGDNDSFLDRQLLVGFSDYYNKDHKPIHDFGGEFFREDWSHEQWNLFYNLMACCVQIYLKHGHIVIENENLLAKKLRQDMGEDFMEWADGYFTKEMDESRTAKDEMLSSFLSRYPDQKKWVKHLQFKKKLLAYCKLKGYGFNPRIPTEKGKPGRDKSNNVEYFTIKYDK